MTQIEWQQLEATVARMTEAERKRLADLVESTSALPTVQQDPVIGLFADDPEMMEKVLELIHHDRETIPFRAGE